MQFVESQSKSRYTLFVAIIWFILRTYYSTDLIAVNTVAYIMRTPRTAMLATSLILLNVHKHRTKINAPWAVVVDGWIATAVVKSAIVVSAQTVASQNDSKSPAVAGRADSWRQINFRHGQGHRVKIDSRWQAWIYLSPMRRHIRFSLPWP